MRRGGLDEAKLFQHRRSSSSLHKKCFGAVTPDTSLIQTGMSGKWPVIRSFGSVRGMRMHKRTMHWIRRGGLIKQFRNSLLPLLWSNRYRPVFILAAQYKM